MPLRHQPTPPTPWDSDLDQPIIAASARVSFKQQILFEETLKDLKWALQ